jgi:hypothetical protein
LPGRHGAAEARQDAGSRQNAILYSKDNFADIGKPLEPAPFFFGFEGGQGE